MVAGGVGELVRTVNHWDGTGSELASLVRRREEAPLSRSRLNQE